MVGSGRGYFSFLYLMYSMRPRRLPDTLARNHDKEIAVAASGLMPMRPKNRTKAPSLIPMPDMEIGNAENMMIRGTKIRQARKGTCSPIPDVRIYTAMILENWTKADIIKAFTIIPF